MSRFRTGSPRKSYTDTLDDAPRPSVESGRSPTARTRFANLADRSYSPDDSLSLKRLFDDDITNDSLSDTAEGLESNNAGVTPIKSPPNMLKRLAMLANSHDRYNAVSDNNFADDAESYVSHTSNSIRETSALLDHPIVMQRETSSTPSWARFQVRAASPLSQIQDDDSINIDTRASVPMTSVPSTPINSQPMPRAQEVADGYISPPQSRRVSPKHITAEQFERPAVPSLFRKLSSPSPVAMKRISTHSSSEEQTSFVGSPRSRLTRTLIEIQKELASSREGIEDIDHRLGVLEQHSSLNPDQLQKHVEDCIRTVLNEADTTADAELDQSTLTEGQIKGSDTTESSTLETTTGDSALGSIWPGSFVFRAFVVGCVGALLAEYVTLTVLNELGRRHNLLPN